MAFNNCDPKTNGETLFFSHIKDHIRTIFDIGCRSDSEFTEFDGEVHYFDPMNEFIENLSSQPNRNSVSKFNNFGLGNETKDLYYYPNYQSFYDRIPSCHASDDANKILLHIKTAKEYIASNSITAIDFVKIDTEGYELNVLKGFEECIKRVKIIQFEYGGTYMDNNTRLVDVIKYLADHGFHKFAYLTANGPLLMSDCTDHYQYCNIVCIRSDSDYVPY